MPFFRPISENLDKETETKDAKRPQERDMKAKLLENEGTHLKSLIAAFNHSISHNKEPPYIFENLVKEPLQLEYEYYLEPSDEGMLVTYSNFMTAQISFLTEFLRRIWKVYSIVLTVNIN